MTEKELHTPCYIIDVERLESNLKTLSALSRRTGCHILLAQKAFSCYAVYPLVASYLQGATASGLYEARLGREHMPGKENHVFSPAFREDEIDEIIGLCDHMVFNSPRQLGLYGPRAKAAGLTVGLRVNPELSTQDHAIYDPCSEGSRLGTTAAELDEAVARDPGLAELIDGLHFHTLCEQDSDALEVTLDAFEAKFGHWLDRVSWVNFGGGHHITREGYDIPRLERCIARMRGRGLEVYLEPGEAVALNAGWLFTKVLEIQPRLRYEDGIPYRCAILDCSAACHMPDVLEMPYRPPLVGSGELGEKAFSYRFGGPTCLAGDVVGNYSFDEELTEGQTLVFGDMAIYSMVKNNTFNGMPLPAIYLKEKGEYRLWKSFGYDDFKARV